MAAEYTERLKTEYKAKEKLTALRNHLKGKKGFKSHVAYLTEIIANYETIIQAKPSGLSSAITAPLTSDELVKATPKMPSKRKGKGGKKKPAKVEFYKLVSQTMGYDWVRNNLLPEYIRKLGIKSCVYCNGQYAITIEKKDGTYTSSYEFDHFLAKSHYPGLSTSFFNLQPSCGHCNILKKEKPVKFNVYAENYADLRPFKFSIDKRSLLEYLLSRDEERLKIDLSSSDSDLKKSHEERFSISKKYAFHKDEAADLVVKSKIYNPAFLRQLNNSMCNHHPEFYDRYLDAILGFPIDEKMIHRRPLTLMKQDIARQLGLLPSSPKP